MARPWATRFFGWRVVQGTRSWFARVRFEAQMRSAVLRKAGGVARGAEVTRRAYTSNPKRLKRYLRSVPGRAVSWDQPRGAFDCSSEGGRKEARRSESFFF